MKQIPVKIAKVYDDAIIPEYAREFDAGFDLHAYLPYMQQERRLNEAHTEIVADHHPITIYPGQRVLIKTGIRVQLPPGTELQVRPRSGLALKQGITVLNSPGTVDSGFIDEVGVILINHGDRPFIVRHNDRIAQGVVAYVNQAVFEVVDDLDGYDRGGGFGHTGGVSG